jgi:hypothetical protein
MKGKLLTAMIIVSSAAAGAGTVWARGQREPPSLTKPYRKIISRSDLMLGHLIGRSESEVLDIKGEPGVKEPGAWTYRQRLGPGAHSFRYSWVLKFRRGKVVEIEEIREAVGCILIPPPREWRR